MPYLSHNIWKNIWRYLYPVKELNNGLIDDSINNIFKNSNYCIKCGENGKCSKCEFCNNMFYFYCNRCKYSEGNHLVCCIGFYNKYGMLN
jgi:hypothetical protein